MALPREIIQAIEDDILYNLSIVENGFIFSFEEVSRKLYKVDPELSSRLSDLVESIAYDPPKKTYNKLLNAGFDEDFSHQISGVLVPLTSGELTSLSRAQNKQDF